MREVLEYLADTIGVSTNQLVSNFGELKGTELLLFDALREYRDNLVLDSIKAANDPDLWLINDILNRWGEYFDEGKIDAIAYRIKTVCLFNEEVREKLPYENRLSCIAGIVIGTVKENLEVAVN